MSAADTIELWERLVSVAPLARGAAVLVARGAAPDLGAACDLPLAVAAEAALAELRQRTGGRVETVLVCPQCGESLDVPVPLDEIARAEGAPAVLEVGGAVLRSPSTRDLMLSLRSEDPAGSLRERCVDWPEDADRHALAVPLAEAADRLLGVAALVAVVGCPGCGAEISADVDLVALLAERVADQARVALAEIAELAAAFGWSEAAILALPQARRRIYLDLVRGG